MSLLLNWRVWVALALAAVLAFTHLTAYRKGKNDVRTEWLASVAEANAEAARLERARQSRADEAARTAAAHEAALRTSVAAARRDADGLRNDLDAANEYAKKSRDAAERTARVATGLLGECSRLLIEDAEAASRADGYARELMQAWPK